MSTPRLNTPLTKLVGIEHPTTATGLVVLVILSGMCRGGPLHKMWPRPGNRQCRRHGIERKDLFDHRGIGLCDRRCGRPPCVVDDRVKPISPTERRIDHPLNIARSGQISNHRQPGTVEHRGGLFERLQTPAAQDARKSQ